MSDQAAASEGAEGGAGAVAERHGDVVEQQADLCAVCFEGWGQDGNEILYCDGCDLPVHQVCYGVPDVPEGDWFCNLCRAVRHGELGSVGDVVCAICSTNERGAFKPLGGSSRGATRWVHLVCVLWNSWTEIADEMAMEPVTKMESFPERRRTQFVCSICKVRGYCVQCSYGRCLKAFHPLCALKKGLLADAVEMPDDTVERKLFCERHSKKEARERERGTAVVMPPAADAPPRRDGSKAATLPRSGTVVSPELAGELARRQKARESKRGKEEEEDDDYEEEEEEDDDDDSDDSDDDDEDSESESSDDGPPLIDKVRSEAKAKAREQKLRLELKRKAIEESEGGGVIELVRKGEKAEDDTAGEVAYEVDDDGREFVVGTDEQYCFVCNTNWWYKDAPMVRCNGCLVAVHLECYGLVAAGGEPRPPRGPWYCEPCSADAWRRLGRLPEPREVVHRGTFQPRRCMVCRTTFRGPMKPALKSDLRTKSGWAHLVCCIWMPETYVWPQETIEQMTSVGGVDTINPDRYTLHCSVCRKTGGCINCDERKCRLAFHPICALRAQLDMRDEDPDGEHAMRRVYCNKHDRRPEGERQEAARRRKITMNDPVWGVASELVFLSDDSDSGDAAVASPKKRRKQSSSSSSKAATKSAKPRPSSKPATKAKVKAKVKAKPKPKAKAKSKGKAPKEKAKRPRPSDDDSDDESSDDGGGGGRKRKKKKAKRKDGEMTKQEIARMVRNHVPTAKKSSQRMTKAERRAMRRKTTPKKKAAASSSSSSSSAAAGAAKKPVARPAAAAPVPPAEPPTLNNDVRVRVIRDLAKSMPVERAKKVEQQVARRAASRQAVYDDTAERLLAELSINAEARVTAGDPAATAADVLSFIAAGRGDGE